MNDLMPFADDGLPLSRLESERLLAEAPPNTGTVAAEDLKMGDDVCVLNLKKDLNELIPLMGQSLYVKAVNLPFLIVSAHADPLKAPITLDVRFMTFMKVTKEYIAAQSENVKRRGGPQV